MPTTTLPSRPNPLPFMISPANQPANAPMAKKTSNPSIFIVSPLLPLKHRTRRGEATPLLIAALTPGCCTERDDHVRIAFKPAGYCCNPAVVCNPKRYPAALWRPACRTTGVSPDIFVRSSARKCGYRFIPCGGEWPPLLSDRHLSRRAMKCTHGCGWCTAHQRRAIS